MAGGGSKPGERRGGRQTGARNKSTVLAQHALRNVQERLTGDLHCDPLAVVVALVQDEDTELEIRARYATELLQYLYPKLKNIEIKGELAGGSDFLMVRELLSVYRHWMQEQGQPLPGALPATWHTEPYTGHVLTSGEDAPMPADEDPAEGHEAVPPPPTRNGASRNGKQ